MIIITDSRSAISALAADSPAHPWVQSILQHAPTNTVYTWVPGHCGVPGNIDADALAGTGISEPRARREIPFADVKRWIAATVRQAWATEWAQATLPFIRKVKGTTKPWTDLKGLKEQRIMSRLRTGHTRISHNYGGTPFRRVCENCGVQASVEHILCQCPQYEPLRRQYGLLVSIRDLLADEPTTTAALMCLLKDANLYNQI